MTTELHWFKSSYSGSGGDNCVEVALDDKCVHVRDSKDTGLRPFTVTSDAWSAFTSYASEF
ncbi:DUF397 domain-containing protein [Streptomyces sp. NBC_00872]|uniref:DUF397 domain-containing protein n=1 Tax=Streptomyces sp. NBC_00872 TaxID=2903686 RepID=UPI00386F1C08|nr:DUF397 domain-containing protein [Streptomyces sp. NBC_00872]